MNSALQNVSYIDAKHMLCLSHSQHAPKTSVQSALPAVVPTGDMKHASKYNSDDSLGVTLDVKAADLA